MGQAIAKSVVVPFIAWNPRPYTVKLPHHVSP